MTMKLAATLLLAACAAMASAAQAEPQWSGTGKIRLIVEVPPVDLKDRKGDTLVASFPVDFDKILAEWGASGSVDLSTLQVHLLDDSGKPVAFPEVRRLAR